MSKMPQIREILIALYGEGFAGQLSSRIANIAHRYQAKLSMARQERRFGSLTEQDAILITYGDQVQEQDSQPLRNLADFCNQYLAGKITGIHVLPFYPYSSDDGFSVINYREVNPQLGTWDDISELGKHFRLMFDAVINHTSAQSEWFQSFLQADPDYRNYFITVKGNPDLTQVIRPRALPLLTQFSTSDGQVKVWTTFSPDQVDLNYSYPQVLVDIIDTLLFYASHGAELLRLDAIAYLWKEIGTACINLPQTHQVIRLIRAVLDEVAPWVMLVTETNIPHAENVAYFGDGQDEAQLVYNFALPPLVLDAIQTQDTRILSKWAEGLSLPSREVTFFNFLASHDGIGINPVRGILPDHRIEDLVRRTLEHGGLVSYKQNPDGSKSPYELNVNYFDAVCNARDEVSLAEQVDRFMAAQAIMLAIIGVPGIYFHSLFGSRGWPEGVKETGQNRSINRQKLQRSELAGELSNPESRRWMVFHRFIQLLHARASSSAFDPFGNQHVIDLGPTIFAIVRSSPDRTARVLCIQNVSSHSQSILLDTRLLAGKQLSDWRLKDLISEQYFLSSRQANIEMAPYQSLWLALEREK